MENNFQVSERTANFVRVLEKLNECAKAFDQAHAFAYDDEEHKGIEEDLNFHAAIDGVRDAVMRCMCDSIERNMFCGSKLI